MIFFKVKPTGFANELHSQGLGLCNYKVRFAIRSDEEGCRRSRLARGHKEFMFGLVRFELLVWPSNVDVQ